MSCCIVGCPYNRGCPKYHAKLPPTSFHTFPHPIRDTERYDSWLANCTNPRVLSKSAETVCRIYRVCRRHFDKDAFNGACKRLVQTAVPTLYLNGEDDANEVQDENEEQDDETHTERSLVRGQKRAHEQEHYEFDLNGDEDMPSLMPIKRATRVDLRDAIVQDESDEEVVISDDEFGEEFEVVLQADEECDEQHAGEVLYEVTDILIEDTDQIAHAITDDQIAEWRQKFYTCPKNRLAQNVCSRVDPFEVCLSRQTIETTQHVFAHKVETEGKPMTNQKSSGRCWLFAALNCIRIPFCKQNNLEEFEFSQSYLFFWDKIERSHFFLRNIVETAQRGEEVTGRLVSFLLSDPTCDGGQWDMLVNLINKHGLIPKKYFPESFCCESSLRLNAVLKSKLREYTKVLRDLIGTGAAADVVNAKIDEQMSEIYTVVGICLGIPPTTFTWEYNDKSKAYKKLGPLTPVEFYQQHVKQCFDVDNKVCLMTDPRPTNKYNEMYTVDCLGNVVGGRPVLYNNQPVELLMEMVAKSIKAGEALWFGCEVSKRFAAKLGIEDLTIHDFKLVFGVDIQTTMTKADRLLYGESAMTHAMVFTAVTCDDKGTPTKFRVENSWGEDRGDKGYLYMSADWFKEFVFEVVVDKKHVSQDVLAVMDKTPIVLPAWDPMGTLAE